jgi:tRNA-(ms[2]io[6]A)-hydroxylase
VLHLEVPTDPDWVTCATADLVATLRDHAHCEMKAAANALSMVARHSDDPVVVRTLVDVAREELDHFERVNAQLEARGVSLGAPPVDPYVAALRRVHTSRGVSPVASDVAGAVDRLLVCALIEARSCERFGLLREALEASEPGLASFYEALRTSEARHYRTFLDLAVRVARGDETGVFRRLEALAEAEGIIVTEQARAKERAAIHG